MSQIHVVSQGLAEGLKEAGWPQGKSAFVWSRLKDSPHDEWDLFPSPYGQPDKEAALMARSCLLVDAHLASELIKGMPYEIEDKYLTIEKINGAYRASYANDDDRGGIFYWREAVEDTLPDAVAKLALALNKEGKMTF